MITDFNTLLAKGDIEQCPACGNYNAYAWQYTNICPNIGKRYQEAGGNDYAAQWKEDVYHIPSASDYEWQCGKCKRSFAPIDSPITAECYTHQSYTEEIYREA